MRKVCMMAVANDLIQTLVARMPQDVWVSGKAECFDRAVTVIRLEGPGLPGWCGEPLNGGTFPYAIAEISTGGAVKFLQSPTPSSHTFYERLVENFANPN